MRILVTGAAGFIGSHLCEALLAKGYTVTGIDNFDPFYSRSQKEFHLKKLLTHPEFAFLELDFTDPQQLNTIKEEAWLVIHLGAKAGVLPSIKHAESYIHTNLQGTFYLLEWMKSRSLTKLIFASSSSVYGNNRSIPFSEEHSVDRPISPYAFSKKSCELLIHTYHHLYKLDAICLRFFTVYGPRQRPDLAIHKFVKKIVNGEQIEMYGDGSTARDYTYIDDTVSGILSSVEYISNSEGLYEIINLGNNSPVRLSDLINMLYKVTDKSPNVKNLPMQPGDVDITYAEISKAKRMLGYEPSTSLFDGLTQFLKWYEEYKG